MSRNRRRVEVIRPIISNIRSKEELSFKNVINSINGEIVVHADSKFLFKKLEEKDGIIIGLITTLQNKDLPPKHNLKSGELSPLNLDKRNESLAFANIFLYDEKTDVLLYEVNKSGCYIDYFAESIRILSKKKDNILVVKFAVVLKPEAYKQIEQMSNFRSFSLEVANPHEIIRSAQEEDDSIVANIVESAANSNSKIVKLEQYAGTLKENPSGLKGIFSLIKSARRFNKSNLKKVKVVGYTPDPEYPGRNKRNIVDLVADSFNNEYFIIPKIQLNKDLQTQDRKEGIKKLYSKIRPQLNIIFGSKIKKE